MVVMEEKQKVVAFLGPKASYTHQVSSKVSYSARQARYNALAKEAFKQVSKFGMPHEVLPFQNPAISLPQQWSSG